MSHAVFDLDQLEKLVVLTGAGVSAASGLPTYRGAQGLWNDPERVAYAMAETFQNDPLGTWNVFGEIRERVADVAPNDAHAALAEIERRLGDRAFALVTQNVDGLHQAAGSTDVLELHGNVFRTRCSRDRCASTPFVDERTVFGRLPICDVCGAIQRPDVVLFGELLPPDAEHRSKAALRGCDLFLAVGTSGTVTPAANFVRAARYEGARTVLLNLEPMDPPNPYFDEEILGRAEELLPDLFGVA